MARHKSRDRFNKPAEAKHEPVSRHEEDNLALSGEHPVDDRPDAVAGMQQIYGNRVIQRLADDASPVELDNEVALRINTSRGKGNPLDKEITQAMNSAFFHNFSDVRVHDDFEAGDLAHELHARAFTVGNDIFVKNGALDLHTQQGEDILSHELTHVVQQSEATGNANTLVIQPVLEQEADRGSVAAGLHLNSTAVQRTEDQPLTERNITGEQADTQIRERFQFMVQLIVQSGGTVPSAAGRINVVDDAVFRQHYEMEYSTPEDRAAHPYEGINAFVDFQGQAWIHRQRGTVGTVIHEALHMYSNPEALEDAMGRQGKEGMTEYFTKKVCMRMNIEREYAEYAEVVQCIEDLVDVVSELWVQNAFFRGHLWGLGHHLDELLGVTHTWAVWCNLMKADRFADASRILTMGPEQLQDTIERLWGQMTDIE